MKIGILGAGSWAIALASLLKKNSHALCMWEFSSKDALMLQTLRQHPLKLPGITIAPDVRITNDIRDAVAFGDYLLCAVPAQTMRATMKALVAATTPQQRKHIRGWIIVSKGIECGSLKTMSEILLEEVPSLTRKKIVVLSGPSHAEEVSRGIPTSVVAASADPALATLVQKQFSTGSFRIYTNDDMHGVELAAGVKNVIALAAGMCDGLGFGDNSKGALLTRGLVEMIRLGVRLGARAETFYGLAGLGDLVTTSISRHSRNRNFGELIGSGLSLKEALSKMVMVAEGVETAKSTHFLAKKLGIEMPITTQVYLALFRGKSPQKTVRDLMMRQHGPELKRAG